MTTTENLKKKNIRKNTVWNFSGQIIPMFILLVAVPILLHKMGTERFGLLTIVWMVVGYFGFFDFGMGKALTQVVASGEFSDRPAELAQLITSVVKYLMLIGLFFGVLLIIFGPIVIERFYHVSPSLYHEANVSLILVALSLPFTVTTSVLRGVLEGAHRFDMANIVKASTASISYLVPAIIAIFNNELHWAVGTLLLFRGIGFIAMWMICKNIFPGLSAFAKLESKPVVKLLRTGGWLTVTNLMNPFLLQVDRLIMGGTIAMSLVAFYTTPFDMVTRVFAIPIAISGVLFPTFTLAFKHSPSKTLNLFEKSFFVLFITIFPILSLGGFFAFDVVKIWINEEFSQNSFRIFQILGWGVLMHSLINVPSNFLQAIGKPQIPGKLYLLETVFLVLAIYFATKEFGIIGTAYVWSIRATFDLVVFIYFSKQSLPVIRIGKICLQLLVALLVYLSIMTFGNQISFTDKIILLAGLLVLISLGLCVGKIRSRVFSEIKYFVK